MMNNVIDYIEENISAPLTLQSISNQFHLSEFHFSRLFKTIVGISLKHYILGRKLTFALEELKNSHTPITDIAYDLGFDYPEVFSRAFKKQFGISPTSYRNETCYVKIVSKASVIDRDIKNFEGVFALKESYTYFDTFTLYGVNIEVNESDIDFEKTLKTTGSKFLTKESHTNTSNHEFFYSIVCCNDNKSGKYTVFFGEETSKTSSKKYKDIYTIPSGWYACFTYCGEMINMRTTFTDDLYHWMIVKQIEPYPNGIGMLNIYDKKNIQNVRILIPIKEAK